MSFATSACRNSVLNVRNFMFGDIEKTLKLADDPTVGSPNLLLALGLSAYLPLPRSKCSACRNSGLNVRNFMFGDIEKTLKLADDPTVGSPNLLLALGLCCY